MSFKLPRLSSQQVFFFANLIIVKFLVQQGYHGSENNSSKWKADLGTSKLAITERLKAPFLPTIPS